MKTTYTEQENREQKERLTRPDGTISIMEMIEDNKKNPPKGKEKKKKTPKRNQSDWYELQGEPQKEEFKHIVSILCRYYDLHRVETQIENPAHLFRKSIVQNSIENLKIYFKKFGKYEFLVVVEISHPEKSKQMDSWIHVDGITQEREMMMDKGKLDHPVFKITSLLDLYNHESTVKIVSLPELQETELVA